MVCVTGVLGQGRIQRCEDGSEEARDDDDEHTQGDAAPLQNETFPDSLPCLLSARAPDALTELQSTQGDATGARRIVFCVGTIRLPEISCIDPETIAACRALEHEGDATEDQQPSKVVGQTMSLIRKTGWDKAERDSRNCQADGQENDYDPPADDLRDNEVGVRVRIVPADPQVCPQ